MIISTCRSTMIERQAPCRSLGARARAGGVLHGSVMRYFPGGSFCLSVVWGMICYLFFLCGKCRGGEGGDMEFYQNMLRVRAAAEGKRGWGGWQARAPPSPRLLASYWRRCCGFGAFPRSGPEGPTGPSGVRGRGPRSARGSRRTARSWCPSSSSASPPARPAGGYAPRGA